MALEQGRVDKSSRSTNAARGGTRSSADVAHVVWHLTTTDEKGEHQSQSFDGTGDGKPVPIPGATDGATQASTVTATTIENTFTNRDGSSERESCSLSPDRKRMTCRGTDSDGKGHNFTYIDVYDRK